jgi:hypothetical protein
MTGGPTPINHAAGEATHPDGYVLPGGDTPRGDLQCSACGVTILSQGDVAGAVAGTTGHYLSCSDCWSLPGVRRSFEVLAAADKRQQEAINKGVDGAYQTDESGLTSYPKGLQIGGELAADTPSVASGWRGDHGSGWE